MAGMLSYAAAGLAQGLGQGIKERGKAKREAKLKEIQHQREMQQDQRQFEQRSELVDKRLGAQEDRLDRRLDAQNSQIAGSFTDDQGNVRYYTQGGDTGTLGKAKLEYEAPDTREVKRGDKIVTEELRDGKWVEIGRAPRFKPDGRGGDGGASPGLSPEDDRLLDALTKRYTKEDPNNMGERITDYGAVSRELRRRGREDLAKWLGPSRQTGMDMAEAQRRARAEADDIAGQNWFWQGDQELFGGQTKEQWITGRTQELMGENRSQQPGQAARKPDILTPRSQRGSGNSASAGDTGSDRPKAQTRSGDGKTNAPTLPRDRSQWQKGKVYSHPAEGRVRYLGDDQFERVR